MARAACRLAQRLRLPGNPLGATGPITITRPAGLLQVYSLSRGGVQHEPACALEATEDAPHGEPPTRLFRFTVATLEYDVSSG